MARFLVAAGVALGLSVSVVLTGCTGPSQPNPELGTYSGPNGASLILDGGGGATLKNIPRKSIDGVDKGSVSGSAGWSIDGSTINFESRQLTPEALDSVGFYAIYADAQVPTVSFYIGPIDNNDRVVLKLK